jgi:DNA-binding response OmpR family regulator
MVATSQRARVLVVDDDPKILSLLRRGLSFEGYAVTSAEDGTGALVSARDEPPDLVVLDVMMPGLDGLEVCRRLRAGGEEVPILMLTAREFDLLELFLRNPRIVLTRDTIFERVWGSDFLGETNVIDVHVKALRDKLEAGGGARVIQTVRGVGYALRES